jgi:hypothetical protein
MTDIANHFKTTYPDGNLTNDQINAEIKNVTTKLADADCTMYIEPFTQHLKSLISKEKKKLSTIQLGGIIGGSVGFVLLVVVLVVVLTKKKRKRVKKRSSKKK